MGDIPMELINEVMSTITDPATMLGPEVRKRRLGALFHECLLLLKSLDVMCEGLPDDEKVSEG